jgi:hypothetical protein
MADITKVDLRKAGHGIVICIERALDVIKLQAFK